MLKQYIAINGKIIASRAWVMTEAWAIVKRFKRMGVDKPISEAMENAWWQANNEIAVQQSSLRSRAHILELAQLGADRLRAMENDIENIDRHSDADRKRLSDIRSAMHYA